MGLHIVAGLVAFTAGDLAAKAAGRGAWHRRDEMGHAGRAHPGEVDAFRNPVDDAAPMTGPTDHRVTSVNGSVAGKRYIADNCRDRRVSRCPAFGSCQPHAIRRGERAGRDRPVDGRWALLAEPG